MTNYHEFMSAPFCLPKRIAKHALANRVEIASHDGVESNNVFVCTRKDALISNVFLPLTPSLDINNLLSLKNTLFGSQFEAVARVDNHLNVVEMVVATNENMPLWKFDEPNGFSSSSVILSSEEITFETARINVLCAGLTGNAVVLQSLQTADGIDQYNLLERLAVKQSLAGQKREYIELLPSDTRHQWGLLVGAMIIATDERTAFPVFDMHALIYNPTLA